MPFFFGIGWGYEKILGSVFLPAKITHESRDSQMD